MSTKVVTTETLKCIAILGSARCTPVVWNPDDTGRLGDRILKFFNSRVAAWNEVETNTKLDVEIFDPSAMPWSQETMKSPMYYLKSDDVSNEIKAACAKIEAADCYVIITPEYNHSIPSALTNLMNQFGCSKYSYKTSGCICYSMTNNGGSRVAQALRPYLSELGCLPVSKQVIFSSAHSLFDQDGVPREGKTWGMRPQEIKDSVEGQCDGLLKQLTWWASAAKAQRAGGLP